MSRKRWLALIAVAMLVVISVSFNLMTTVNQAGSVNPLSGEWTETIVENGEDLGGTIALLELNGTIQDTDGGLFATGYQHQDFLSQIEHASSDPNVEGIILRVNTPGGGVLESAEIHEKIVQAQEEYGKPVFISMGGMAASGGYYISAPADLIVASPHTITGSIGVIMESVNISGLLDRYGVEFNTIKSGPYKDIMSSSREMTEDERAILQSMIDESYEEFVHIIATGRGMSEEEVRAIADGRIYSGKQSLELNLVDELGNLDDTIALMKEALHADYTVVKYQTGAGFGFGQFLSMSMKELFTKDSELASLERLMSQDRAPMLKYLYTE